MKQKDPLKKEKEEIKILVQATEKFIKELPVNKDDLIGKIKNFNHHYGAFVGSKLVHYEKSDFVKIINSMTPELWKYYLQITEKSIQQNLGEVQLQQIITSKFKFLYTRFLRLRQRLLWNYILHVWKRRHV